MRRPWQTAEKGGAQCGEREARKTESDRDPLPTDHMSSRVCIQRVSPAGGF
ncbi:hypothetical protein Cadr_000016694 [Camelus dromedarius]|uniref:Uncharacterized protein n=1 Tax=Camelus dromedarius TaxID=9838 RepID=A0A5N4DH05_CAMDR|nr:hypothetical protein Cadr_000016694 [Camelus dromedarius]